MIRLAFHAHFKIEIEAYTKKGGEKVNVPTNDAKKITQNIFKPRDKGRRLPYSP